MLFFFPLSCFLIHPYFNGRFIHFGFIWLIYRFESEHPSDNWQFNFFHLNIYVNIHLCWSLFAQHCHWTRRRRCTSDCIGTIRSGGNLFSWCPMSICLFDQCQTAHDNAEKLSHFCALISSSPVLLAVFNVALDYSRVVAVCPFVLVCSSSLFLFWFCVLIIVVYNKWLNRHNLKFLLATRLLIVSSSCFW
jgi:hypothetical protein